MESNDEPLTQGLIYDYREADLDPARRALCDYAVTLTLDPGAHSADDIAELKDAGWTEEQIVIATQVIGYFNYINRIADGLGVDDEDWMKPGHDEWRQRKGSFRTVDQ